jgi:hypothetical protein
VHTWLDRLPWNLTWRTDILLIISYRSYNVIERLLGNCKEFQLWLHRSSKNRGPNCARMRPLTRPRTRRPFWLHVTRAPRQVTFVCIFSLRLGKFHHTRNENGIRRESSPLASGLSSACTPWPRMPRPTEGEAYVGCVNIITRLRSSLWKKIIGDLYVDCLANACTGFQVSWGENACDFSHSQVHAKAFTEW